MKQRINGTLAALTGYHLERVGGSTNGKVKKQPPLDGVGNPTANGWDNYSKKRSEIGPGGGRFTRILLDKCKKLIAVDVAPTMLKRLEERYANEGDKILGPGGKAVIQHSNTFSELGWNHLLRDMRKQLNPAQEAVRDLRRQQPRHHA